MRLLHTADWHLGARLGAHDRLADHKVAIDSLLRGAAEANPDLIIHAGDLFDGFNPGHEVLHTALHAIDKLAEIAPLVVLGGNHDSYALLRALETLTRRAHRERLQLVTEPSAVPVQTEHSGKAWIGCVPFISAGRALQGRNVSPEDRRAAYAERIAEISNNVWEQVQANSAGSDANVYSAHLYIAGSRPGKSERRVTISDDYATDGKRVPAADYGAFGHIHDPQTIPGSPTSLYSGSLIALDFGESTQEKHSWIVEIGSGKPLWHGLQHQTGRQLFDFEGELHELLQTAARGELDDRIVRAVVNSDTRIYDLTRQIVEAAPDAIIHELTNMVRNQEAKAVTDYDYRPVAEPPLADLYVEWRRSRTKSERDNDDIAKQLFQEALDNGDAPGTSDMGVAELTKSAEKAIAAVNRTEG